MKKHLPRILLLASLTLALTASASEMGVPGLSALKSIKTITPTVNFPGKLESKQFVSSVDDAQNSWRSVLREEDNGIRIGLKVGEWPRPDAETVDTVWLANSIDWAKVNTRGRDLEFTYTFDDSTAGVQAIFKFGATVDSVKSAAGDCSFTLTFGENGCTFRRGADATSGELPFKIKTGTTVRIRIKGNKSADIWIDDQPILADQAVDLDTNFISILARTDTPSLPHILQLSSLEAKLVRAK